MGTIVALAGFEHGLGELPQGSVAPAGIVIQSWPDSAFYRSLEGEPAMTVVPNLALSGIATIALSIVVLVWVVRFVERPNSALVIAGSAVDRVELREGRDASLGRPADPAPAR